MRPILLMDFGSTFTKLTAVDLEQVRVLGHAQAFTTATSDLSRGMEEALAKLEASCGKLTYEARLACSSAAGGLNMVACGLVPSLTSKAAKLASFGAGAKVEKSYAYQLTEEDIQEIESIKPDILLLTGGTDGGNSEVIIGNAGMLAGCRGSFPIVVAGNRSARSACQKALEGSSHPVYTAPNVMPRMNELNVQPVQDVIRAVFLEHIVKAKGLSKTQDLLDGILMPTPAAVLQALQLLSKGSGQRKGIGELIALDLGGATTDVYSIATGDPSNPSTVVLGLPEPHDKRTVEGDIGMRYSARGILEGSGAQQLSQTAGLAPEQFTLILEALLHQPNRLPQSPDEVQVDAALATHAIAIALARHAGTIQQVYTPVGPVYHQNGKDLTRVHRFILTGGALIYAQDAQFLLDQALALQGPAALSPRQGSLVKDEQYILSALGLLAGYDEEAALTLLLRYFGKDRNHELSQ